jgi:hypothetical protein
MKVVTQDQPLQLHRTRTAAAHGQRGYESRTRKKQLGRSRNSIPASPLPTPWSVEEQPACFVVRDHDGQQLAYVYYEEEPGRRPAAKLLTKDGARRIAANISKLPVLLC